MCDKALLGLLMTTLDGDATYVIVGSKSTQEAWNALLERFSTVSRANIMQLKTDLQTVKNGSDSIDKYFLRIKLARDQLRLVGVQIVDEDIIVVTLNGLPNEYSIIKTMIRARDTRISLKDFHAQLIVVERDIQAQLSLTPLASMTAMPARGTTYKSNSSHYNEKDTHSESNVGGYKNFGGDSSTTHIESNDGGSVILPSVESPPSGPDRYSIQDEVCSNCLMLGLLASRAGGGLHHTHRRIQELRPGGTWTFTREKKRLLIVDIQPSISNDLVDRLPAMEGPTPDILPVDRHLGYLAMVKDHRYHIRKVLLQAPQEDIMIRDM
ncbi:hypothetical protein ACLB2K_026655 [Fragaria x ananassa]